MIFPQAPENDISDISDFFEEIFTSQGAPLVSTTPVANFATCTAGVVDTGGKFVTSIKR